MKEKTRPTHGNHTDREKEDRCQANISRRKHPGIKALYLGEVDQGKTVPKQKR